MRVHALHLTRPLTRGLSRGLTLGVAGALCTACDVTIKRDAGTPAAAAVTDTVVRVDTVVRIDTVLVHDTLFALGDAEPDSVSAPAPTTTTDLDALRARHLLVPVRGVLPSQLRPTFDETRGGGSRKHEALDIMAPRGTPVLAADDGRVAKLFTSQAGGLTVYVASVDGRFMYYYAHLDRYRDGLAEGAAVRRGDVLGAVGSTGDASPTAPHLHFAIARVSDAAKWWTGTPIDPYPLLASAP